MKYTFYALCLLLLGSFAPLKAQKKNTGYIITVTGDTLHGHFNFSQPGAAMSMNVRVTFTDDKSNIMKKYAPFQIKGWQMDKDPIFNESKVLKRKGEEDGYAVFMQRLNTKGEVICYRYTENGAAMPVTEYYLEKNQILTEIPFTKKYYEVLATYFKDNKDLSTQIEAKTYKGNKEKALLQVVELYNDWFEVNW